MLLSTLLDPYSTIPQPNEKNKTEQTVVRGEQVPAVELGNIYNAATGSGRRAFFSAGKVHVCTGYLFSHCLLSK